MSRTFKNWPNMTVVTICAVILLGAFVLGVATSPGAHRTELSIGSLQQNESVNTPAVSATPQSILHEDKYIDYSVIYPQNEP